MTRPLSELVEPKFIDITPDMITAGCIELAGYDANTDSPSDVVRRIFVAMISAIPPNHKGEKHGEKNS